MILRDLSIDLRVTEIDERIKAIPRIIQISPKLKPTVTLLLFMVFLLKSKNKNGHPDSKNTQNKFLRLLMCII